MDPNTSALISQLGLSLSSLIVKGTTSAIQKKIEVSSNEKDIKILRASYDEMINQLLQERAEAIRIASVYKEELSKVEISEEDIRHLHSTVSKVLEILKVMTPGNTSLKSFEQLKELISVDTLTSMQLLGFNYKAAIGEPLTDLCADAIKNHNKRNKIKKK